MRSIRDPRTGQIILVNDDNNSIVPAPPQLPFSEKPRDQVSLEEAMQQKIPQPGNPAPTPSSLIGTLAKDYAVKQAKDYAIKEGAKALGFSGAGGGISVAGSAAGPTLGAATGVGYGAPTVASGITGVAGVDTVVPAATNIAGGGSSAFSSIAPGVAGAALLYDLSQNRKRIGTRSGYLQAAGAGAGIGGGIGMAVGGPIGAGVGAGIGTGVGLIGNALGIGHKSRTKGEEELRKTLGKHGINVGNSGVKEWELNPTFKNSRKESDLTGKDIVHAARFYTDIPNYAQLDPAKQEAIANQALKEGIVRETKGTIELSKSANFDKFVQAQLGGPTPVVGTSNSSGGQRKPAKKALPKKEKEVPLLRSLIPSQVRAPDYEVTPTPLFKNPYL